MSKKMELTYKQLLILRCEYQIVWLDNVDVNAILMTQDSVNSTFVSELSASVPRISRIIKFFLCFFFSPKRETTR